MHPPIADHHIRKFPLTSISVLSPYTGLIISVVLLVFFLLKFYVLELFLLQKLYGTRYTGLDEVNRRGFVNHHIAGATKLVILIIAVYPFGNVAFGTAGFHTPFIGSRVTMGDMLLISAQMLIGMFLFELIYRTKISPVSMVGFICVSWEWDDEFNADLGTPHGEHFSRPSRYHHQHFQERKFQHRVPHVYRVGCVPISCNIFRPITSLHAGAFDIVSEFLPHLTIILYRVYPDSHHFLMTMFRAACVTTLFGTIAETIVVMFLFGQLWSRWKLSFKIATPILHIAFSIAQFHGTRIFYRMWRKQERIIRDQQVEKGTGEGNSGLGVISSDVRAVHLDIQSSKCDLRISTTSANMTASPARGPLLSAAALSAPGSPAAISSSLSVLLGVGLTAPINLIE
jgi:hypothetical protein